MAEDGPDLEESMMDLSQVRKTIDGDGFTFIKLDCVGKNVSSINVLTEYPHLRQVDLSRNSIKDVSPLLDVPHILRLNLSGNRIDNVDPWVCGRHVLKHVLYLDLSGNKLAALPPLRMPALKRVNFAKNEIVTCEAFEGHSKLESLDLSENRLESLQGVQDMPRLQILNVASNALASAKGVCKVQALHTLDFSKNKLEDLKDVKEEADVSAWDEMKALRSLNLSGNEIKAANALETLMKLPNLSSIDMASNPVTEEDGVNIKLEILIFNYHVKKIDGEDVEDDDRTQAKELNEDRLEKERQRKAEEEEARKAAEEARKAAEEGAEEEK